MAVRYRASGAIFNPWYLYPVSTTSGPGIAFVEDAPEISSACSMQLPELALAIIIGPRDLTFASIDGTQRGFAHMEPLRWYIMYRTFLDYNGEYIASPAGTLPDQVDPLRFSVLRLVRHETPIEGGVAVHHTDAPETIDVSSAEIRRFLNVLDRPLAFAIGFYIGVTDPRYILGEYYKSFESIVKAMGGFTRMVNALTPYGVSASECRNFKRLCNDGAQSPTGLGRHAPEPNAPLRVVNMRNLCDDRDFMAYFETATKCCRAVIHAYIAHRAQLPRS